MADKSSSGGTQPAAPSSNAGLGAVQQTLFIPLAARARESGRKRALLRDPKAAEIVASVDFDTAKYGQGWGGFMTVLRTVIFDTWIGDFLTGHPAGTVIDIGTGLNTRFERVDNGQVHWIDLDLPDTIELRRKFFADSGRRRMIAASALEEDWLATVQASPGPYFFVAHGVLTYLAEAARTAAAAVPLAIAAGQPRRGRSRCGHAVPVPLRVAMPPSRRRGPRTAPRSGAGSPGRRGYHGPFG